MGKELMKTIITIATIGILAMVSDPPQRTLTASWYGEKYNGRKTASGQVFDAAKHTAASWDYPLGTKLRIWNGPRFVVVTVNDRGPAKRLLGTRQLDLSLAAFSRLADPAAGLLHNLKVEVMK
jgi:rare lipoprotein A